MQPVNAMTVDVEDYFQVQAFSKVIDRDDWDNIAPRVAQNTNSILDMFAVANIKATFFTLGWVAKREPALIERIVAEGHELASHGMAHFRADQQSADEFRQDITEAKSILEDIGGCHVRGYRAATFSIGKNNLWAFDALKQAGYNYSSSVNPVKHDLYGMPDAPRFAYRPCGQDGILEIPITTMAGMRGNIPCGGGGYFRLFPYVWFRRNLRKMQACEGQSSIFYFHPWEIDPKQPRVKGIPLKSRVRHYLNIGRMEGRMKRLLKDFPWDRVDRVFAAKIGGEKQV